MELAPVTKKSRQETDFKLCIQCQLSDARGLVNEPSLESYAKFLRFTHERGQYGDSEYPQISRRLERYSATDLKDMQAKWHRTCYGSTCNSSHLERARVRHQKACQEGKSGYLQNKRGRPSYAPTHAPCSSQSETRFTRAASLPSNVDLCFFCQKVTKDALHEVSTFNAGKQLQRTVEESNNQEWKVQLSAAISADDARAIDVKYHLSCWVQNVQRGNKRRDEDEERVQQEANIGIVASDIEFLNLVRSRLQAGEVLSMADLKSVYSRILDTNGVHNEHLSTRIIKEKITSRIEDIHFAKAIRRNEPDRIYSSRVRDAAVEETMTKTAENDIQRLFESASILRGVIAAESRHPWQFNGDLNIDDAENHVPKALYAFTRWVLEGPTTSMETETVRSATIHRDVLSVSQNIMYSFRSKRQVTYKPIHQDAPFRHRLEWPQLLAVGIAVHQSTRSKKLLQLLHGFGLSVDYSRVLRLETQLAKSVIEITREQGAYLPATMRRERFIYFAVDNSDFNEDTPDGKRTLHATATALYQQQDRPTDTQDRIKLRLHGQKARDRSLRSLTSPDFVPCYAPSTHVTKSTTFSNFKPGKNHEVMKLCSAQDIAWLLSRALVRTTEAEDTQVMYDQPPSEGFQSAVSQPPPQLTEAVPVQVTGATLTSDQLPSERFRPAVLQPPPQPAAGSNVKHHNIPTWSAYNSLLASEKPLTEVGALPLIAAPAHEWQTLITVLKQTEQINCMVVGPDRKTVITLDMALYERAKQLEMARDDCKGKWVLRLGEMHIVMAALRAAGNAIEDSGLDEAWNEADIYGPTTTRQILEAKHMKRALEAHLTTVQVLFDLYVDEFFLEHPQLKRPCAESAQRINVSCIDHIRQEMLKEHQSMLAVLTSHQVLQAMTRFDEKKEADSPLFKFTRRYMRMVLAIYAFIRATRDGIWELHLTSLDELCKYFFAHDKQKYARLVPLYLAEMNALVSTDPNIYQEFMAGNFTVNKNRIPFCSIGVDHALEHINRIMKVTGGLVGITQNASARERFFLTAPELSRLAEEAHRMTGSSKATRKVHHDLSMAVWTRQEQNVIRLKDVIRSSMNPMTYDGRDLTNIITKVVMPLQVQIDVCSQDEVGQQKYVTFVEERINKSEVNIWARMKKVQLKMWKSARKAVKHKLADQVIEMKDDRSLFARMLIVARSRPEINLKEAIGQHEFTSLPRAFFTMSGDLLPCTDKSKLMNILEELPNQKKNDNDDSQQPEAVTTDGSPIPTKKVTVIDGMAVVHAMGKPPWVNTCAQWAEHFTSTLDSKAKEYDEVHLVFDRYDVTSSLKEATRQRRQGGKQPTNYHVSDSTLIGKVSVKQFLSSASTKDELTVYLAKKALQHFEQKPDVFIVTSKQDVFSNCMDVQHLRSSQEEADTRIILHSLDAVRRGASQLYIQSPDTDVFVLAIRRYHQLCKDTYFITGMGHKRRIISLEPVVHALGSLMTAAIPGFHAFSGADQTGRFAGKGKLTCWQALNRCPVEVVSAFAALGTTHDLSSDTERNIEVFVCQLYEPGTAVVDVGDLRWRLFTKKQLEAQKLPPTRGALHEAIARAHFQAVVWAQDNVFDPQLPPVTEYGWEADGDRLVPITTRNPPAPATITHLVKCGCKKSKCMSHCSCRSQRLNCSEMCLCGADEEVCDNVINEHLVGIDDDDDDDDGDPSI